MSSQAYRVKLTYEDYLLFPDDGKRHELIDGDHYVTPSPATKHQRISRNLMTSLHTWVSRHQLGEVFAAPTDVVLSDVDVVVPDLLFVSAARMSIITAANIQGAPDLVVEILSESTRKVDEAIKRRLYERYRVQEYWIVDPVLEIVKVFRLADKGYVRVAELTKEDNHSLTTPLLPALAITLADLFA